MKLFFLFLILSVSNLSFDVASTQVPIPLEIAKHYPKKKITPRSLFQFLQTAQTCNTDCPFQICGTNFAGSNLAIVSDRFSPMTDEVCLRRPSTTVRRILRTRQAWVKLRGSKRFRPISKISVNGFPRNTFFANFFTSTPANGIRTDSLSAIGYTGVAPRAAIEGLDGACVKLPIGRWENGKRKIISRDRRCVGFTAVVAKVEVRLSWDSEDDFDIFVREPNNIVVSFDGDGVGGFLVQDQGFQDEQCTNPIRSGRTERIVYPVSANFTPGEYVVFAVLSDKCPGSDPARYKLQIVKDGKVIFEKSGTVTEKEFLETNNAGVGLVSQSFTL